MTGALIFLGLGLLGLCVGSFIATAVLRAFGKENFVLGRSRCDGCGHALGYLDTLPLVIFMRRSGLAACCGGRIDPLHPAGELGGLVVLVAAALPGRVIEGSLLALHGFALLALALIDLKTRRLPNVLVAGCAFVALLLAALRGRESLVIGLAAGALTYLILEGVRRAFASLRGQAGLGGGDVKLIAALALCLGPLTPAVVALSAALGLGQALLIRPADRRIAFGPWIAVSGFAATLYVTIGGPFS